MSTNERMGAQCFRSGDILYRARPCLRRGLCGFPVLHHHSISLNTTITIPTRLRPQHDVRSSSQIHPTINSAVSQTFKWKDLREDITNITSKDRSSMSTTIMSPLAGSDVCPELNEPPGTASTCPTRQSSDPGTRDGASARSIDDPLSSHKEQKATGG